MADSMNLQTFLESGLLESYALDQCTPAERQLVEQMLQQHEAARAELQAIETALEQYASTQATAPPPWMKGKIMDEIAKNPPEQDPQLQPPSAARRPPSTWIVLGLCLVLAAAAWYFGSNTAALRHDIQELEQKQQDCDTRQTDLQAQLDFLLHPATQRGPLQWLDPAMINSRGLAVVYKNPILQSAYLHVDQLPPLGPDQDYQLWVITETNPTPAPLPVVPAGARLLKIPYTDGAKTYALSLEPKGGSPNGIPSRLLGAG